MYRIGICDDDVVFCTELEKLIDGFAGQEQLSVSVEVFFSGDMLLQYLKEKPPLDLLFLDIEMEGVNGIEAGQRIREKVECEVTQIVFVSVKENYAMQLFKIRPFDFLTKPLDQEKVFHVLGEYKRLFMDRNVFFTYQVGKSTYRISENEIRFFKCQGKKINAVTLSGTKEFYGKMSDIQKQLSPAKFCAIHKSYIINMNYVKAFFPDEVFMEGGEKLPISQSHKKSVKKTVLEWNMQGRQR